MQMVSYGQVPGAYASRAYTPSYLRTAAPVPQPAAVTATPGGGYLEPVNRLLASLTGQSAGEDEAPQEQKKGGFFGLLKKVAIGLAVLLVAKKVLGSLKKRQTEAAQAQALDLEA